MKPDYRKTSFKPGNRHSSARWLLVLLVSFLMPLKALPANVEAPGLPAELAAMVLANEKMRVETLLDQAMKAPVMTVTASVSERSEGGIHDYYSEGDYWWPDPANPDGPYIRRDGESNPDNFNDHRRALITFSDTVGTLATAYLLDGQDEYADRVAKHLDAWFVADATRMNPHLTYAQAIRHRTSGRSIGIIDTVHLAEVALAAGRLAQCDALPQPTLHGTKQWFRHYLHWLNTSPFGIEEKEHPNNHSVAWSLQASAFALLTSNQEVLEDIRRRFKAVYVGDMMASNGSFPAELARTKPYGYSLFMLDLMAGLSATLSTDSVNLWLTQLDDGRSIRKMYTFIVPFIENKSDWPYPPDVQYWDAWPAQHVGLILAAQPLQHTEYAKLWRSLRTRRDVLEVMRNLPLRNALLWLPPFTNCGGQR